MEKRTYLEACKLTKVILLESSSKLHTTNLEKAKLEVTLSHELEFSLLPEGEKSNFCLNFNTILKATNDDDCEFFDISTRYRADFKVFDKDKTPPEKFEEIAELLGHQVFPVIRSLLIELLTRMGIPPQIPWSVQQPISEQSKKKTISKTKKGRG